MEKTFEARTEQEAVDLAVREFGVNEDYIEIEILQKSKGTLFGRNSKVIIKASVLGLPKHEDRSHQLQDNAVVTYAEDEPKQEASQEHQEQICSIVKNLIEKIGINVECEFSLDNSYYVVSLNTDIEEEQNLLIGKHGKNIEAIQNLCNAIIQSHIRDFPDHIVIDVEQYRKKRAEWLGGIARKKADYVLRTGKYALLDELGPFDRKLIHRVIREFDGVTTFSTGDGYYKRVKIYLE